MSTTAKASTVAQHERAQPESFRARSLSAGLTVKDLQKSLAWYRDVLGFTLEQPFERDGKVVGASLKAGDVSIMLGQNDGAKGWDRKKDEGFRLHLKTVQSVDELVATIKERGGALASEPADMPWGARAFNLVDSDGFLMTISKDI